MAWIHPDQAEAGSAIGVPLNQDALRALAERLGQHKVYVFTFQGKPVDQCSTRMVLRYAHLATEQLREAASRIDDTNLTQRPNLRLVHSR